MKLFRVEKITLTDDEIDLLNEAFDLLRKISDNLETEHFSDKEGSILNECNLSLTHLGNFLDNCEVE